MRDRCRLDEFLLVGLVVLPRFFLGDLQLAAELLGLHLRQQELLLDVPANVADRHAFLLQRGLELLVVLEALVLPHRRQPAVELIVAETQPLLAAELHDEQLVDGVDQQLRRDFGDRLLQLLVVLQDFGTDLAFAERANLPLLELGLGDDVAVHLDQYLLDDLRDEACPAAIAIAPGATIHAAASSHHGRRRGLSYLHFNHLNNCNTTF